MLKLIWHFSHLIVLCGFAAKVGFGSEKQKNYVLFCFSLTLHYLCNMIKVRLIPYRAELGTIYHRQSKGHQLVSLDGRYQFFVEEDIDDPDFVVVQGKGLRQTQMFHVAPQNTIMLATEPKSVLVYPKRYLRQFGMVCTCQEGTKHPNVHYGLAVLPWFVAYTEKEGKCAYTLDYDQLKAAPTPPKEKLISVITSNKAFTRGHLDRIHFVEALKAHFGDRLDVFGRGFRPFDDKWDVLAPYRYHIAIENSSQRYYWTEKISDSFLTETYPFYYGCTHLEDYFPQEAFTPIDIHDAPRAIATIEAALASDRYEAAKAALTEAKRRVLDEYNIFEYVVRLCDRLDPNAPRQEVTLRPCRSSNDWHNLYNYTIGHNLFKLKMKLTGNKL